MNKEEAFAEINHLQDEYVNELVRIMEDPDYQIMKAINFTSPTGTGKTKMMGKLINKFPKCFFIVTTLSKGQLQFQVRTELQKDCKYGNFYVYGSADYRINSKLDAEDILSRIPRGTDCIWLRDEGHIATNRWDEILVEACKKVINFSATNIHTDILCNFTQTMMLRTVSQDTGTPEDAINKLLEVKAAHKNVQNYNPCAIFRCVNSGSRLEKHVESLCKKNHLKYINITDDSYIMSELCEDNNKYDVIINKFKLVEGIDIRRAHVLYMDNQPKNVATTIQAIGRCRRNALLYRDDIDILSSKNKALLKQTRKCYVYYNVEKMRIDADENGELFMAFCDHVSCEKLKANTTISVTNGQLSNGLYIIELEGKTGKYSIIKDENTGFNVVEPLTEFYDTKKEETNKYFYSFDNKISVHNLSKLPLFTKTPDNYSISELKRFGWKEGEPFYYLSKQIPYYDVKLPEHCDISSLLDEFLRVKEDFTESLIEKRLLNSSRLVFLDRVKDEAYKIVTITTAKRCVSEYLRNNHIEKEENQFREIIQGINKFAIQGDKQRYTLDAFLDEYSLQLIKYCLIKSRRTGASVREITQSIHVFLSKVQNMIQYREKINWHVAIYLLLHPNYKNCKIQCSFHEECKFTCVTKNKKNYAIDVKSVHNYFEEFKRKFYLNDAYFWCDTNYFASIDLLVKPAVKQINSTEKKLRNNTLDCLYVSYASLFEPLDEKELYMRRKGFLEFQSVIPQKAIDLGYKSFTKIINDKESAIIGTDLMRQIITEDNNAIWIEASTVSSKIGNYTKFNSFLSRRYEKELASAIPQCFSGTNSFDFPRRCNSMIGYCVEFYSKYLIYGQDYLWMNIWRALNEFDVSNTYRKQSKYRDKIDYLKSNGLIDNLIVRACMLKYKEIMVRCYGYNVGRVISSISIDELVKPNYSEFVKLIVLLGTKTAKYVKRELYPEVTPCNNVDPNLSITHISGLADYITEDAILDVKVRNNIDENCLRQVLAYHYLSTKRSDLHIKKVIVYDAVSDRAIVIDITKENINQTC